MSSSSRRSSVIGMQIRPRPCLAMKLMTSGVTFSAAMVRSPSFSRSSSSTTMIIRPSRKASMAASMGEKGERAFDAFVFIASPRPWRAARIFRSDRTRGSRGLDLPGAQVGVLPGERDDLHVEPFVVHAGDRQADRRPRRWTLYGRPAPPATAETSPSSTSCRRPGESPRSCRSRPRAPVRSARRRAPSASIGRSRFTATRA